VLMVRPGSRSRSRPIVPPPKVRPLHTSVSSRALRGKQGTMKPARQWRASNCVQVNGLPWRLCSVREPPAARR